MADTKPTPGFLAGEGMEVLVCKDRAIGEVFAGRKAGVRALRNVSTISKRRVLKHLAANATSVHSVPPSTIEA